MGTQEGEVRVFNSDRLVVTTYCLSMNTTLGESVSPAAVLALKMQPGEGGILLVAYEGRPAVVWSFKSSKVVKTLHFESPINCFDWTADGNAIVAGLRDGNIVIWDYASKETEPKRLLRVHSDLAVLSVSAVDRVLSLASSVLVTGGQPKGGGLSFLPSGDSPTWVKIDLPDEVYSVVGVPSAEGDKAFVLTEKCGLFSVSLTTAETQPKPAFFLSVLGPSRIVQSTLSTVASDGTAVLDFLAGFPVLSDSTLTGGLLSESLTDSFGVLITAHEDGLIRLWRVSKQRLTALANLSLNSAFPYADVQDTFHFPGISEDIITLLEFNVSAGLLLLGNCLGWLGVWKALPGSFELLFKAKITSTALCACTLMSCSRDTMAVFGDIAGNLSVVSLAVGDVILVTSLAEGKGGIRQNVLISEIVAMPEAGVAVVAVSNGGLYQVNVETLEVEPSPVCLNADFVSETPKRSDFGIIKLLPVMPLPNLLVVCYEKLGFTVSLPHFHQLSGIQWTSPLFSASVNLFNTQAYVTTLDKSGILALWSLPDLCLKWKADTSLPLK